MSDTDFTRTVEEITPERPTEVLRESGAIGVFPTVPVAIVGGWAVLLTAMITSKELR